MEVLRSAPQLEALCDDWNALADLQGHALLRHEWVFSAAKMLHAAGRLAVVIRTRDERLEAVAPLARTMVNGIERLEFIGAEALYEPTGFLARDARARALLLRDLVKLGRPLMLRRLSAASDAPDLQKAAGGRGILLVKNTAPSLSVALRADGPETPVQLPGKLRYDVKRARTRAGESGEVTVDVIAPTERDVDETLDAFIKVEASGWKGRHGSALGTSKRTQAFFRMFCRLSARAGTLRMFFLKVGSTIAAAQIAVEAYERLWILKIGYDEGMAHCSPGFLLTAEAIEHARRQGLRSYEFLGIAEKWEERWRPEKRACSAAAFYPWSVGGGLSASFDLARTAWRRIRSEPKHAS